MHRPIIPLDSKYVFPFDVHVTFPLPRKDQSFVESQSVSHVFGKQRKSPMCWQALPHYNSKCCLSQQTKALDGSQEAPVLKPQTSSRVCAHEGFQSVERIINWNHFLCVGHCLTFKTGFQWVYGEIRVPSVLCAATVLCWDTHHIHNLEQWSSCYFSLGACPLSPGPGRSSSGQYELPSLSQRGFWTIREKKTSVLWAEPQLNVSL